MATVELRFRTKAALKRVFLDDVGIGGMLWVTRDNVAMGDEHDFDLWVVGSPRRFALRGRVVWRKAKPPGRSDLPEGAGVEFDEEAIDKVDDLIAYLQGDEDDEIQAERDERDVVRYQVDLPCEFLARRTLTSGRVLDISETGLRLASDTLLDDGAHFCFFVYAPSERVPLVFEGEVAWRRPAEDPPSMGVRLLYDSTAHEEAVRAFVERIAETAPPVPT